MPMKARVFFLSISAIIASMVLLSACLSPFSAGDRTAVGAEGKGEGEGPCEDGFCREAVMSSCGSAEYVPIPGWECTASDGQLGYCCLPASWCSAGGYCTTLYTPVACHAGFEMTQMGCNVGGKPGSCCILKDECIAGVDCDSGVCVAGTG